MRLVGGGGTAPIGRPKKTPGRLSADMRLLKVEHFKSTNCEVTLQDKFKCRDTVAQL